jgi:iron-sulfur cluster repair protein YtfE (RIC family)
MKEDHRACDNEFANMENAIADDDWIEGKKLFEKFGGDLLHHFDMEEDVMFPAFETRSENAHCNPTPVMIMEHDQMRHLINSMSEAVKEKDKDKFFGLSETLMMTMQQHNMKEEQMMYPMIDEAMAAESSMLLDEMQELKRKN